MKEICVAKKDETFMGSMAKILCPSREKGGRLLILSGY